MVGEAGTGTDAAPTVLEHRPDLVCLDIELPGRDGLAVLAELKTAHPALPVIMISSASDRETITRAVGQGASGYILKPFDPERCLPPCGGGPGRRPRRLLGAIRGLGSRRMRLGEERGERSRKSSNSRTGELRKNLAAGFDPDAVGVGVGSWGVSP